MQRAGTRATRVFQIPRNGSATFVGVPDIAWAGAQNQSNSQLEETVAGMNLPQGMNLGGDHIRFGGRHVHGHGAHVHQPFLRVLQVQMKSHRVLLGRSRKVTT